MLTTRILLPSCSIPFIDPGGSSETEHTLMRVPKEEPLPVLVVPLKQIGGDALFLRFFLELRQLFGAWRDLSSPSHPFLLDQVLYRGSYCSEGYALDGGMQESDNDHPLGFTLGQ